MSKIIRADKNKWSEGSWRETPALVGIGSVLKVSDTGDVLSSLALRCKLWAGRGRFIAFELPGLSNRIAQGIEQVIETAGQGAASDNQISTGIVARVCEQCGGDSFSSVVTDHRIPGRIILRLTCHGCAHETSVSCRPIPDPMPSETRDGQAMQEKEEPVPGRTTPRRPSGSGPEDAGTEGKGSS